MDIFERRAREQGIPYVDLTHTEPDALALASVPADLAWRYCVLPLRRNSLGLYVAMANVNSLVALTEIGLVSGCPIRAVMASPSAIKTALMRFYGAPPEDTE